MDATATDARTGRERCRTLPWGCSGDVGTRGKSADAARPTRADTTESLRVVRRLTCPGHPSVIGLENRVSSLGSASATPGRANLRTKIAFVFVRPAPFRHGCAPSRHALTPTAFGLMTESACGSSTRHAPARCGLASVRSTMRRREPSRLDVEHPSMRRKRTQDSATVQYAAMVRQPAGVVHMLGEPRAGALGDAPNPAAKKGQRGPLARSDTQNLHQRLVVQRRNVLRFTRRADTPFTNNRSERDIRMAKVKQKVSGCFRTVSFAHAYCRISSYLQTMAALGYNPLVATTIALHGNAVDCLNQDNE